MDDERLEKDSVFGFGLVMVGYLWKESGGTMWPGGMYPKTRNMHKK